MRCGTLATLPCDRNQMQKNSIDIAVMEKTQAESSVCQRIIKNIDCSRQIISHHEEETISNI